MGDTKLVFKRYEKKYLLSRGQYETLFRELQDHIVPDAYHRSTVCSIYYDTDDYELIRRSIEAPVYKEKLRLRSYGVPGDDGTVFIELKKKYKGMVYKRRVPMGAKAAAAYLAGEAAPTESSQMTREIDWFLHENDVKPKAFIACDRYAWVDRENPELRITFDENLRWRTDRLDLTLGADGESLTEPGAVLMEIKIPGTAPLWLARLLSDQRVFPTSFSKYGTCYKNHILSEYFNGVIVCV
ncbi:MAG: polyphosphate polymerase domain-containing protein [Oscillospiraceae bacterium]|nr:polyphosphate polymerase domain-containing protein [Oscillospiraceae bacterium]